MQRLFLALIALAAIVALALLALAAGRRLLSIAGPVETLPQHRETPLQKIAFVLLALLVLYVSFGGG